jgi:lipopolysaccharide transport system ATP-binding protein
MTAPVQPSYEMEDRDDSGPAIHARGLGKAYLIFSKPEDRLKQMIFKRRRFFEEYWAFQGIDLDIQTGETVGIIGRNGSGKSTLLQVIAGTLEPTTGTCSVRGRVAPLLELGAGFNPEFTGRENVRLAGTILGLSRDEVSARLEAILAFAGIGDFIEQPVKTYSSGMYARLAFAVAAHVDADIFIVDEILSVGDFSFQSKCLAKLEERRAAGATVLFVSHDISQVRKICDRAIYMKNGRLAAFGPVREVCDRYFEDSSGLMAAEAPVRRIVEPLDSGTVSPRSEAHPIGPDMLAEFADSVHPFRTGPRTKGHIDYVSVNGNQQELAHVDFGDQIVVEVYATVSKSMADATISVYIIDAAGQMIIGTNSRYEGLPPDALSQHGQHRISFAFENRLLSAEYGVTVILSTFDPKGPTEYEDYITIARRLTCLPSPENQRWALFNPEMTLRHDPIAE